MTADKIMPLWWWQQNLNLRIDNIKSSLEGKAKEYAEDEDRMHNFNRAVDASAGRYSTREAAMFGMLLKHWTSILDILDNNDKGTHTPLPLLREKFGDMINYMILMEASIIHTQYPGTFQVPYKDMVGLNKYPPEQGGPAYKSAVKERIGNLDKSFGV